MHCSSPHLTRLTLEGVCFGLQIHPAWHGAVEAAENGLQHLKELRAYDVHFGVDIAQALLDPDEMPELEKVVVEHCSIHGALGALADLYRRRRNKEEATVWEKTLR